MMEGNKSIDIEAVENDIKKKLVNFCQLLPGHVQVWKDTIQQMQDPVRALINFSEQLRSVESAKITYLDNFSSVQQQLVLKILGLCKHNIIFTVFSEITNCTISGHIEEEIDSIKTSTEKINKTNHDLKNKLALLEQATIDLDWDLESPTVKGSALQPPLAKLLALSYDFWIFFSETSRNMTAKLKALNVRDEKSMKECQKSFALNLDSIDKNEVVYKLLALTQYVINEKAVL